MNLSIALLSIARPTFDVPLAQSVADSAYALLTDAGFEVVGAGTELLMDADAAARAISALASAEFDLLVIFQASFADSTMAVEIAAEASVLCVWLTMGSAGKGVAEWGPFVGSKAGSGGRICAVAGTFGKRQGDGETAACLAWTGAATSACATQVAATSGVAFVSSKNGFERTSAVAETHGMMPKQRVENFSVHRREDSSR